MHKLLDLRHHKVQIADRYRLHSKVMTRDGAATGGWINYKDLSGQIVTILKVNQKSLTVALRKGRMVSVFNIVTNAKFKVLPIKAEKLPI